MPSTSTHTLSLRSEEVQEVITSKPSIIERWSIWIFLSIIFIVILGAWFIKYPDIIQSTATLTADYAPKEIINKQEGRIVKLLVSNEQYVIAGQMIAWIEANGNHGEVIRLSELVDTINLILNGKNVKITSKLSFEQFENLGELQPAYQVYLVAWQQFKDYFETGYFSSRRKSLQKDEENLIKMNQTIKEQLKLSSDDLDLLKETMASNNLLFEEKVISRQDIRDIKSRLLSKQMTIPQIQEALLINEISQQDKKKELDELDHAFSQQNMIFKQASQTFKSLLNEWQKKYIVSAPIAGKIAFTIPIQENQFLSANKNIGFVNPPNSKYYAILTLGQYNFGKVTVGQKVQLRLDAYPYQEFGYIEGTLSYISKVPSDSGFLTTIELENGLKTNYGNYVQYRSGLKSQALVITKNSTLLNRLFYNVIKYVDR